MGDGDRLAHHLAAAGPQPFDESKLFIDRLREALDAWRSMTEKAALVVIREVVGGLVMDAAGNLYGNAHNLFEIAAGTYWLTTLKSRRTTPAMQTFRTWLLENLAEA